MQAKTFSEVQDSSLLVSIIGDMGEARTFHGSQPEISGKYIMIIMCYATVWMLRFVYHNMGKGIMGSWGPPPLQILSAMLPHTRN